MQWESRLLVQVYLKKGTTNGVISDIDGNFSLNVSAPNAIIVISYIGFKSLELPASDPNLKRIVMKEDTEVLDEVVVVGYGTQKEGVFDWCGDCCRS